MRASQRDAGLLRAVGPVGLAARLGALSALVYLVQSFAARARE